MNKEIEESYIPELWANKVIQELNSFKALEVEFKPKYKGNNKFLIWICKKFKLGNTVIKYPNYFSNELKKGSKVRINTINFPKL